MQQIGLAVLLVQEGQAPEVDPGKYVDPVAVLADGEGVVGETDGNLVQISGSPQGVQNFPLLDRDIGRILSGSKIALAVGDLETGTRNLDLDAVVASVRCGSRRGVGEHVIEGLTVGNLLQPPEEIVVVVEMDPARFQGQLGQGL